MSLSRKSGLRHVNNPRFVRVFKQEHLVPDSRLEQPPDEPFRNFRASRSGDRRILCSSGTSCDERLESVRIGKCQNKKLSEFESVRIGKFQNYLKFENSLYMSQIML